MTGPEIRLKIDYNNEQLDLVTHNHLGTFTLNHDALTLMGLNQHLQSICPHEFKDGKCIFCDKEEPNEDQTV